jgi:hypothetical protein
MEFWDNDEIDQDMLPQGGPKQQIANLYKENIIWTVSDTIKYFLWPIFTPMTEKLQKYIIKHQIKNKQQN